MVPDVLSAGLCLYGPKGVGKSSILARVANYYQEDRYDVEETGQVVVANLFIRNLWERPPLAKFPVCSKPAPTASRAHEHSASCLSLYTLQRCDAHMWDWLLYGAPVTLGMVVVDELADVLPIWGAMSHRMRDSTTTLRGLRHRQLDLIGGTTHPERVTALATEQIEFYGLVTAGYRESRWSPPDWARVDVYRFDGGRLPEAPTRSGRLSSTIVDLRDLWTTPPAYYSWSKMSPHWTRSLRAVGQCPDEYRGWTPLSVEGFEDYEGYEPAAPPAMLEVA